MPGRDSPEHPHHSAKWVSQIEKLQSNGPTQATCLLSLRLPGFVHVGRDCFFKSVHLVPASAPFLRSQPAAF